MSASYAELYAWLTTDLEGFWSAIAEFFALGPVAVRFDTPNIPEAIVAFLASPGLTRRAPMATGHWQMRDDAAGSHPERMTRTALRR